MSIFAVLSDLHLSSGLRGEETRRIHRWAVEALRDRALDGILIAGDFFDRRSLPEERVEGADLLLDLATIAPVVGISGNHDVPGDLAVFNRLGRAGAHPISFYEEPRVHQLGGVAIAALPWHREAPPAAVFRLPAAERAAAEDRFVLDKLDALDAQLAAAGAASRLVLAHVMLREAAVHVGQPEGRGREFKLSLADLGHVHADAYVLGHVHASQDFRIGASPVFYTGSTTRRTYGEIERKYIAILHVVGSAVSVEWVELPVTPMLSATVAWEELEPGRWGWAGDVAALEADAAGTDIRLTYAVPEAQRQVAALAARELQGRLEAAGAVRVKPAEEVIVVTRARAPEIARVSSLTEKLAIALTQRGCPATAPQHARVLSIFAARVAPETAVATQMAPCFESVRVQGFGVFLDETELDLAGLPGDLVAVVGEPGAGKSSLLEALCGAVHQKRETPTRGSFDALADGHGKGAFVEVTFSGPAHRYRVRYEPNRDRAFLWEDEVEIKLDGKVSRVGAWLDEHLIDPEVVNAAFFLSQRSEGLIAADGTARRAGLLRAIGIAAIERLAARAREIAREADKALAAAAEEAARLAPGAAQLGVWTDKLVVAETALREAECRRAAAVERLRAARDAATLFTAREVERGAAAERAAGAAARVAAAEARVRTIEARLNEQSDLLKRAVTIAAGAVRARGIATEMAALRADEAARLVEAAAARAAAADADQAKEAESARWRTAQGQRRGAEERLRDRGAIEEALASLPILRTAASAATAELEVAEARASAGRTALATTADGRLGCLRGALDGIERAKRLAEAKGIAREALGADEIAAIGAGAVELAALDAAVASRRAAAGEAARALAAAERAAARAGEMAAAELALREAGEALAAAKDAGVAAKERADAARTAAGAAASAGAALGTTLAALALEAAAVEPFLAQESAVAAADQAERMLAGELAVARAEACEARIALDALPLAPPAVPRPEVAVEEAEVEREAGAISTLTLQIAAVSREHGGAARSAARAAELDAARPALEEAVSDANALADALGIGGVQSLEIDAAGPAITANMNRLLHAAYGSRYTAEVNATRQSKDGKKRIDETEILVLDTLAPRPRKADVRTYSGGERVHLSTAFFWALAEYICNTRGITRPTIVLDEPGSGLGENTVGPWVDMVRHAARLVGARRVVVVTHHPQVIDAADTVVRIEGGRVSVER